MVVVSSRTFSRNQMHYMGLANSGEKVIVESPRMGRFVLKPERKPRAPKKRVLTEADLERFCEEGENPPVEVDAETRAAIEFARGQIRNGEYLHFKTAQDSIAYFDSL